MAGKVENFGALVAAEQLPAVLTHGAPVLVGVVLWHRFLFRVGLRLGLIALVDGGGRRGGGRHQSLRRRPGLRLSAGAAVR